MASNNYYYYDEDKGEFMPADQKNRGQSSLLHASLWVMLGIIISTALISIYIYAFGNPVSVSLKQKNRTLTKQLKKTKSSLSELDDKVHHLAKNDNNLYRSILGMDPISYDERKAGAGGADIYSKFDVFSKSTSQILKRTAEHINNLRRSINIQTSSFKTIKRYYNRNQKKMAHIPAIKPTGGIILSGFGMRYHPILKYRRMHNGLDFRASVGSNVYATGDGVVKYAKRKGTFGRLLIIDHSFGYETYYAHLSSFVKGIRPGTKIKRGELVAYTGNSGLTEGPHLHYEVHKNGKPVDPINYLFANTTPKEYRMYKNIVAQNNKSMD